jgi:uncharacterized protein (DUF1330 family)
MYVSGTDDQWELLKAADPNVPIAMLNLIRFRDTALDGHECDAMTGQQAYAEYGRRLRTLADEFPGTAFWVGDAEATVIGPAEESWDLVLLVRYESVTIFRDMLGSAQYQAAAVARTAAVADSRLVLMHESFDAEQAAAKWASNTASEDKASGDDQPIVMLNLISYQERALEGNTCDGMSGEEAYVEYVRRLEAMNDHDFPGQLIWDGEGQATVIGPETESWDRILLMAYPSVGEFRRMANSAAYQTAGPARTAAVLDSRLIRMNQMFPRA